FLPCADEVGLGGAATFVAAASRRHRTRELTGGEVTRLGQRAEMSLEQLAASVSRGSNRSVGPSSEVHRFPGSPLNVAARVAALARPSEILVSQTVKDLVAGSGLRFHERGSRQLKGVEGAWHLY